MTESDRLQRMVGNGCLNSASLHLVQQPDLYLATGTAWAWLRLQGAAKSNLNRSITIARRCGAYRSVIMQGQVQHAWDTRDPALMREFNLDPGSRVRPANPGGSNHGLGIAVDIVGTTIDAPLITLAKRYGFTFPYLGSDPRHAVHDGRTAVTPIPPPVDHKRVAAYLNSRKLGRQSDTRETGRPDTDYVWLLQTAGNRDGLYPTPPFKRDGRWGPKTRWLDRYYDGKLK